MRYPDHMGRPREFDEKDVLATALETFRSRGYAGTSMRDLAERTGVAASALYRTWGDKHQLFLRCMDSYASDQAGSLKKYVETDGPVLPSLSEWIGSRIVGAPGCLIVNTAAELGTDDAATASRARAAWAVLTQMIESALHRGQTTGEIGNTVDIPAMSQALLTVVIGLRVRGRAGEDAAMLRATFDSVLGALAGD